MINQAFVIGDIHGELDKLKTLLTKWNPDSELLVFLGDYVDRGKNACGVIQLVRKLHQEYGAKAIGGNHEDLFLSWLDDPEDYWFAKWREDESCLNYIEEVGESESVAYYSGGGDKTISSFYGESVAYRYLPSRHAEHIKTHFAEDIAFLRGLPNYVEWNEYLFVHAGINLAYSDWKKTSDHEFRWIRNPFHYMRNETGKKIVFGHHLTRNLHKDGSNDIWVSPCRTKIGIDGGAVFKGLLHGIQIQENHCTIHSVDGEHHLSKKEIII